MSVRRNTRHLLGAAQELAQQLAQSTSGKRFSPARLSEATRFLAKQRDMAQLKTWIELMPNSFHRELSRSAKDELNTLKERIEPLIAAFPDPDELLYILGWAERLLLKPNRGSDGRNGPSMGSKARRG